MPVEEFNDGVHIHGESTDKTQLEVRGPAAQTEPLQEWQDPSGVPQSQVTADGRLEIGDPSTPSALVQANDEDVDLTGSVKRGIQTRGKVNGSVAEPLSWSATELELSGSGGVGSDQSAQRVQIVHDNTGDSSNADLRAGDFNAINKRGDSGTPTGTLSGVHIGVTNEASAHLDEANALKIEAPVNGGTIAKLHGIQIEDVDQGGENYALHTGAGLVHLGDVIELTEQLEEDVPHTPHATGTVQLYAKDDGKLYAHNGSTEMDLTGSGSGLDEKVAVSANDTTPNYLDGKLVMGSSKLTKSVLNGGADEDLQLDVDPSQIDLDELGDVNAPTPGDGQALTFNSSVGQWEAATLAGADEKVKVSANDTTPDYLLAKLVAGPNITLDESFDGGNENIKIAASGGANDLNDLSDVVITSPVTGEVLRHNGTNWIDSLLSLEDLSDVQISSVGVSQGLIHDGSTFVNSSISDQVANVRLSLHSTNPVPNTASGSTLYIHPFKGNKISLYTGTYWKVYSLSGTISQSLSALSANTVYDVFLYDNGESIAVDLAAWSSWTARATALVLQNGVYVKSGATGRRYIGSIFVETAGSSSDGEQRRFIYNYYNQQIRRGYLDESTTHTYGSSTARAWNNASANRVRALFGLPYETVQVNIQAFLESDTNGSAAQVGVSLDTTMSMGEQKVRYESTNQFWGGSSTLLVPGLGVHDFQIVENALGGATGTFRRAVLSTLLNQ